MADPEYWDFEAVLEKKDHVLMWTSYILVPGKIVAEVREQDPERRVVVTFNDEITHHAALMPRGKGEYFIMLNQKLRKDLAARYGHSLQVRMRLDKSEYGVPMPEEFEVALYEDEPALAHFRRLSPGKQRALIHIVGKVKNPDLRIRKAVIICDHLNAQRGDLDFKILQDDFRRG